MLRSSTSFSTERPYLAPGDLAVPVLTERAVRSPFCLQTRNLTSQILKIKVQETLYFSFDILSIKKVIPSLELSLLNVEVSHAVVKM